MHIDDSQWSYNEFLAFLMVYGAEMNNKLSPEELLFIQTRTGITDIAKIKAKLEGVSDMEAIEVIDDYKKRYLPLAENRKKAISDLEAMLKSPGEHSQLEKVAVHMIEKLM